MNMKNGGRGSINADVADTIALLMWQPRTVRELSEVTGLFMESMRIRVDALHEAGIVRVVGRKPHKGRGTGGPRPRVYGMQAKPFELPDTPEVLLP